MLFPGGLLYNSEPSLVVYEKPISDAPRRITLGPRILKSSAFVRVRKLTKSPIEQKPTTDDYPQNELRKFLMTTTNEIG